MEKGKILNKADRFRRRCQHGNYVIDDSLNTVECGICGQALNPIWLLTQFADRESCVRREFKRLEELNKKADKKNRCKCEHCGKMTQIQRG